MLIKLHRQACFKNKVLVYTYSIVVNLLLSILLCKNANAQAINHEAKKIQIAMSAEPPDLNYLKATDQVSFFIIEHIMEGLLAYGAKGELIPGIAERWELNEQGAKFYLRKDARWSDGVAVTARDFVFGWQMVVNPETASRYAFILAPIKNAERIVEGKLPIESLGVKALDDFTLEVTFERPCAYFLDLSTFATYFPVRQDFYLQHKERYFSDVNTMIFNGPYVLSKWVHGASLRLDKNSNFWNAGNIKINVIDIPYLTEDTSVTFNLFRNGEITYSDLDENTIPLALIERMSINSFGLGAVEFLNFNHNSKNITSNKNFRKAIQSIFDPEEIVYKIIALPGNKPSYSIFPSWLIGDKEKLNFEAPPIKPKLDLDQAKIYLKKAKQDLGLEIIPPLVLLSSDKPSSIKRAEYLQEHLKVSLGLDIKIDKQIFKQRIEKLSGGEFDLAMSSWGPDYNDPSTFGDLLYSKNNNNHGKYQSKQYDYWVEQAMNNTDTHQRVIAFSEMQRIIYEDVVVLPQFERGIVYVENPKVKGVVRRIFGGDPSFRYAYIDE